MSEDDWVYDPVTATYWHFVPEVGKLYSLQPCDDDVYEVSGKMIFVTGVYEEPCPPLHRRLFMVCLDGEKIRHISLELYSPFNQTVLFDFTEITENTVPIGT